MSLTLVLLGLLLGAKSADFLLALRNALTQLRTLADAGCFARIEQFLLATHRGGDVCLVHAPGKAFREGDRVCALAFRQEAHPPGIILVELGAQHAERCAGNGVVEADQDLALFHRAAILDQDLLDHASGRMLHLLVDGFHDHGAGRDHRASELADRSPTADATHEHHHHRQADDVQFADHRACVAVPRARTGFRIHLQSRIRIGTCSHEPTSSLVRAAARHCLLPPPAAAVPAACARWRRVGRRPVAHHCPRLRSCRTAPAPSAGAK